MVDPKLVKQQLEKIDADSSLWCRAERRELPRIMFEGEQINHLINGRWSGGFATLVATDQRVLLIDKKPLYLTLEDIRYDMISDVMFNNRLINATLLLGTLNKTITFMSFNQHKLREFTNFVQQRVMDFRNAGQSASPVATVTEMQAPTVDATPAISMPAQPSGNPYKMPVMIRNRVSKYY